ncbi:MAG TPA: hypothetical protein VHY22_14585 [Chthoniobacteraceae bacterium]|nr:hypothetical protein [Chthoniobacteraceae bacterium]
MHTVAESKKASARSQRPKSRGLLVFLLILAVIVGGLAYPPTFLFVVRQGLAFEAWRYGFHLSIGRMDGSIADPIWLYDSRLSLSSDAGTTTQLAVDTAHTRFAWRHLFWQRDQTLWSDLTLDGVRGTIDLPAAASPAPRATPAALFHALGAAREPRLVLPASLTIDHASFLIRQSEGSVRMDDVDLQASDLVSGYVVIGALSIQEPWMTSVFSNCRGSLLLQGSQLELADMRLADSLRVVSATADLPALLRGQLQMQFNLDAFSGNIAGELSSAAREEHLQFESSGTFSNISVAQLAAFFGEDADGIIKQGKFTFRGSPRDLAKATFTTRFEAGNFRWGARKWNSLIAGATYVDHRLQTLDFELHQAHNVLFLKGNMDVPQNWRQWWKADFAFDVSAKIDDLRELSALLGSDFGDIFGKLTVDGSVRGADSSFDGQLIVSGSHLSFRKAPLDELEAAIKLQGNEIQVTNAEFTHGDDFLRAQGVVNILGEKQYWGEVKANIADLAVYSAFLRPPIAPEAFGGGLSLDWSGDGAPSAHSGAFTVRLNHLRPLGAGETWQPFDLNAEATYSPESIFFSNLVIGNGATSLASRVVATPRSLTLQSLKLLHGKNVWLTGDAQVPLNVWAAWEHPGTASWWNFESPCKLDLKLSKLEIGDTLALTGRQWPYDGELTGNLKSDGTLAKLTADGRLAVKNASATFPAGVLKSAAGALAFSGSQVALTSGSGSWNDLAWTASGIVTASDVRKPDIGLTIKIPSAPLTLGQGISATAALDLRTGGAPDALALSGTARALTLAIRDKATLQALVAPGSCGLQGALPALALPGPSAWKLDIRVTGTAATELSNATGSVMPSLNVTGAIGKPALAGEIGIHGFSIAEGPDKATIPDGTFYLNPGHSPGISLHAAGVAGGDPFDGYIFGTLAEKYCTWSPETTDALAGYVDTALPDTMPFTLGAPIPAPSPAPAPNVMTPETARMKQ